MRVIALAVVATVAALAPATEAAVFAEVSGTWFWYTDGYVRGRTNLGQPVDTIIFFGDQGDFFYRAYFDPLHRTYVQCRNGEGFIFLTGPAVPLTSCSLEQDGSVAVAMARIRVEPGALPASLGRYEPFTSGILGTGSFRIG